MRYLGGNMKKREEVVGYILQGDLSEEPCSLENLKLAVESGSIEEGEFVYKVIRAGKTVRGIELYD